MTLDLKALREIAERATPGPWVADAPDYPYRLLVAVRAPGHLPVVKDAVALHLLSQNAEFIATFNPSLVLKLLDVVEAADAANSWLHFGLAGDDPEVVLRELLRLSARVGRRIRAARPGFPTPGCPSTMSSW